MIYYAIAVGVVITLVIIRQLPRSEKAAGETQNSNATTRTPGLIINRDWRTIAEEATICDR